MSDCVHEWVDGRCIHCGYVLKFEAGATADGGMYILADVTLKEVWTSEDVECKSE